MVQEHYWRGNSNSHYLISSLSYSKQSQNTFDHTYYTCYNSHVTLCRTSAWNSLLGCSPKCSTGCKDYWTWIYFLSTPTHRAVLPFDHLKSFVKWLDSCIFREHFPKANTKLPLVSWDIFDISFFRSDQPSCIHPTSCVAPTVRPRPAIPWCPTCNETLDDCMRRSSDTMRSRSKVSKRRSECNKGVEHDERHMMFVIETIEMLMKVECQVSAMTFEYLVEGLKGLVRIKLIFGGTCFRGH